MPIRNVPTKPVPLPPVSYGKPLPSIPKPSYLNQLVNWIGKTINKFGEGYYLKPLGRLLGYRGPMMAKGEFRAPGLKSLEYKNIKIPKVLVDTPFMKVTETPEEGLYAGGYKQKVALEKEAARQRGVSILPSQIKEYRDPLSVAFYTGLAGKYMRRGFGVLDLTEKEKHQRRINLYGDIIAMSERRMKELFPSEIRHFSPQSPISRKKKGK